MAKRTERRQTSELTTVRVAAAVRAIGLTVLATIAAVILVAILGELIPRVRLERTTPAERRAPAARVVRSRLRGA